LIKNSEPFGSEFLMLNANSAKSENRRGDFFDSHCRLTNSGKEQFVLLSYHINFGTKTTCIYMKSLCSTVVSKMLSSVCDALTYHTLWGYLQCGQSTSSIASRLQLQATNCVG